MTEASSLGNMDTAPVLNGKKDAGAWTLWEKIAVDRPGVRTSFGLRRPYRRVQMGVVHHDLPRSDLPPHRSGLDRQCAWGRAV